MIQMATFQSAVRAAESVQEFQAAGHSASSTEVLLRDGTRAFAVLLGPFVDRAQAEDALARAQQVPGYGAGTIVKTEFPTPSEDPK
jgi:cell division septation protein DedD